jgi:riboflavin kinase/FMN adenylyltransferase
MAQGRPISSSRIRAKIVAGRIDLASDLLGRPYSLAGTVVAGAGRGGPVLNTPTANLSLPAEAVIPKTGVYAVKVVIDGKVRDGAANIGDNPTFASPGCPSPLSIEVHILDFSGSALHKPLAMHFVERIRDEEAFPSPAALKARIRDDIARIREVLGKFDNTRLVR